MHRHIIFAIFLLNPLWLCILYKHLPLGSIGPIVILSWPLNSVLGPYFLCSYATTIRQKKWRILSFITAIPLGLLIAVLQLNSYFSLTILFGLDDFQWI